MKVILNSDIVNLGEEGDIRTVAPGYARNYLLPQGLVLEYNPRNVAMLEERRAEIDARKAAKRQEAATIKEKIESAPLTMSMTAGTNGKLFGSVTAATVVEQLAARGIEIERKRVEIPENTIKTVGNFKVRIRLYGDEEATLVVSVDASNAQEIAAQKARESREEAPADATTAEDAEVATSGDAIDGAEADESGEEESLDPEVMAMRAAAAEEAAAAEAAEDDEA